MTDLLFAYGTLRRASGHPKAERLEAESEWVAKVCAAGRLYRVDWYPAFVEDPSFPTWVFGDLFRLRDVASWTWLDTFEGCGSDDPQPHEYRRRLISVMQGANTGQAFTYVWNGDRLDLELIAGGDWIAELR